MSNEANAASARRPGRPKAGSEDKKTRILCEALTLFSTRGYAATSLSDIAREAEISKAGLLHHFASKEQLLADVLETRDQKTLSALGVVATASQALDHWVLMVEGNEKDSEGVALYTAMSAAVIDPSHRAHPWFASHLNTAITFLQSALEKGKESGEVRADAPCEQIARKLVALSDGLQIQWLSEKAEGRDHVFRMSDVMRGVVEDVKKQWLINRETQ